MIRATLTEDEVLRLCPEPRALATALLASERFSVIEQRAASRAIWIANAVSFGVSMLAVVACLLMLFWSRR